MKNYITEFIGTFFLVFVIVLTVGHGTPLAPLAIGATLMVMVYMGGHVSGGHYNPAVSLAVLLRGRMAPKDLIPYWIAQIVGSIAAAYLAHLITGKAPAVTPGQNVADLHAILIEIIFTFALALVVLNTATAKSTSGNSFYGLAIGFTVVVAAFAGGPISGGAFNPAVGIGPNLVANNLGDLWIYIIGPLVGAAAAWVVFKVQNPGDN